MEFNGFKVAVAPVRGAATPRWGAGATPPRWCRRRQVRASSAIPVWHFRCTTYSGAMANPIIATEGLSKRGM